MTDPVTPAQSRRLPISDGVPDQGLLFCDLCRATNLPNSYYCCQCGEPLAGGPLDPATRSEVAELLRSAAALDPTAPVFLAEGTTFNSRCLLETVSVWPASLATTDFVNDPWQRQTLLPYARVLVIDASQLSVKDWVPFLETVAKANEPLVVVSGGYAANVVVTLAVNNTRGVLRCAALRLTPPAETHGLLLQDIARALRTSVVAAPKLERTDLASLPLAQEVRADVTRTLACGLAAVAAPPLQGDAALVAHRKDIYGRQAVRVVFGENSRANMQARVRYAARLLNAQAVPPRGNETGILIGERPVGG